MPKFRKRPVVIEACEFSGAFASVSGLVGQSTTCTATMEGGNALLVRTLDGEMLAEVGDWIILGTHGELYPVKAEIFAANYEPAE